MSVPLCVCHSNLQPNRSANFDGILHKYLQFKRTLFSFFLNFALNDVITAFFVISLAALSHIQFLSIFFPIDILCSSANGIVCDCKPVFSINFFSTTWPTKMAKMTGKMKMCVKREKKIISCWYWVLMMDMAIFFSSVASLPREITEKKNDKTLLLFFFSRHYNT